MNAPLFVIALVLGVLKLCAVIALSWWWIALIWPGIGLIAVVAFLLCAAVAASMVRPGRFTR